MIRLLGSSKNRVAPIKGAEREPEGVSRHIQIVASGFGLCQAAGRVGAFVAIPSFLWIQQGFGLTAVFVVIAVIVAIAAVAVTQIGPEAKGLALDEIAPPTA